MVIDKTKNILFRIIIAPLIRRLSISCGEKVRIGFGSRGDWNNVSFGNDVYLGPGTSIISSNAQIYFGDHIIVGPNVTFITGDHRVNCVGQYISLVGECDKLPENDLSIVCEGDNWIGANATILKGVNIGKGAVVGAASVVTHSVEPYSVVCGNPAVKVKMRFAPSEILQHEEVLNQGKNG